MAAASPQDDGHSLLVRLHTSALCINREKEEEINSLPPLQMGLNIEVKITGETLAL